jgi:hypothetical protein
MLIPMLKRLFRLCYQQDPQIPQPLAIDTTSKPRVHGEEVLVRVGAAGIYQVIYI